LPSTSIDTFFACTIIVAVALIATAFLTSTMQNGINSTQDINKESYLQSIADHIITSPGAPVNWGGSSIVPADFGLAASSSTAPYELDIDKITRLNNLNTYSLSYTDMENAAKLNNIALGITVSQVMSIDIEQTSNSTIDNGNNVSFNFAILTSIDSKPTSANLNCYVVANGCLSNLTDSTSVIGVGSLTVQIPSSETSNAMLIVFGRASFDGRITSCAIYNFLNSSQESAPGNAILSLTPHNYTLSFSTNSTNIAILNGYIFTYLHQENLTPVQGATQYSIPTLIDKSPFVIVICGFDNGTYFQEWVSYPQVPFKAGSSFEGSEQNVFPYIVTINGVLYNLDLSFGDVVP
jgi:hypothetical protein